jgi:hypothetical protein
MQATLSAVRRARWAVAAIFLANGSIIGTWAAHIPLVEERLGISHTVLGFALLSMAAGALAAMPLGGAAIGRLGSAFVTRASAIILFAAFLLPLVAPRPALLFPALFIFGAANGTLDVAMNAHGVLVERKLGRPVMSSYHGMWSLGGLLGAGLAAALLPVMPPFVQATLVLAIMGTVAGLALFFLLPSASDGGSGPAFALPSRLTLGLGLLCFLCLATEGAVIDWSALHLEESLGLTAGPAAAGFAAFSACMALSRFGGDWLRARTGDVTLVRWSALLGAVGLAVALLVPLPFPAIAGYALVGLGVANLVPVFFGAAGRLPGQASGTGIAAVATMGYAGFLVGPPVIGFVADLTSLSAALGLLGLACLTISAAAHAVQPAARPAEAR